MGLEDFESLKSFERNILTIRAIHNEKLCLQEKN